MSAEAEEFFAEAETYIARGLAALESNHEETLKELDGTAIRLSGMVKELARELHSEHAEHLKQLMSDLEVFARQMQDRRSKIREEMLGLMKFRQAGIAYLTADASDRH